MNARAESAATSMAALQGATPPTWAQRSRWSLLRDVLGGWRQTGDRLAQLVQLLTAFLRPRLVRARLERLRALGHIDVVPTTAQILVAARDQMFLGAIEETKMFYRSQGIPWVFHNFRRFLSGPATVLDPAGLFSPRDTIVHHVLQTFHRHPVYDLVLLRGFPDGLQIMETQAAQILKGSHPHQRALTSLIEDGGYHQRLLGQVRHFRSDPFLPAEPIPPGLVADPYLMLAMDQFKDLRGFTSYASRLPVGPGNAAAAWLAVLADSLVGSSSRTGKGRQQRRVRVAACDADIVKRWIPARES